MKNPLKPEDHKKFDEFILKWKRLLNLDNWRVERGSGFSRAMAEVQISIEDRLAVYKTGKTFGSMEPVTPLSLEKTAVHELLHIFLQDYHEAVKSGSNEFIMAAEHSIITVLENLLLKDNKCSDSLTASSLNSD